MCAKKTKNDKTKEAQEDTNKSVDVSDNVQEQKKIVKSKKPKGTATAEVPRGMPKSKRPWKTPKTKYAPCLDVMFIQHFINYKIFNFV